MFCSLVGELHSPVCFGLEPTKCFCLLRPRLSSTMRSFASNGSVVFSSRTPPPRKTLPPATIAQLHFIPLYATLFRRSVGFKTVMHSRNLPSRNPIFREYQDSYLIESLRAKVNILESEIEASKRKNDFMELDSKINSCIPREDKATMAQVR